MFEFKPDYEQSKARMDAFWECELIDRPVVQFHLSKPLGECVPVPASNHSTSAEWWLDAEYQAELALAQLTNQEFLGYIPSNDFSIMISTAMFEEVFMPGLIRDCQFLDRSIYHLDGPGALRHLDAILAIPELDALQYVPGASNEGYHKWVGVYRKAQAAGKAIEVFCTVQEIDAVMETLDPHGVYLSVSGVPSREVGAAMLKRLETWGSGRLHPVVGTEGNAHG